MTKRIALVPYEPGQEPEGMVSSLDPDGITPTEDGKVANLIDPAERVALAAAVKAAKRDPWEEWRESLRLPWSRHGGVYDSHGAGVTGDDASLAHEYLVAAAPDMAEALRRLYRAAFTAPGVPNAVMDEALNALRKAGAPVDEPESFRETVGKLAEESRRMPEAVREMSGVAPIINPESAEGVPELWVSRDRCDGVGSLWPCEPLLSSGGDVYVHSRGRNLVILPHALADTLALKPGDCRRVTRDEYERYFEPVLKLDPSERYAALERLVP